MLSMVIKNLLSMVIKNLKMSKFVHIQQAFDKRFFSNGTELNLNDLSVLPTVHCTMRKLHNVSVKRKYLKYFNNIFNIFFSVCASMETLPSIRQITL